METTLLTPSLQNKCQPGGWMPTGSQGSLCFAGYQFKMSCTRTSRAVPGMASSISPTFLPLAPAHVGNKMKIMSVQIGPKELFQGEQARVFNYTSFTLMTFTALLEKSFIPSSVLDSVGLGAVTVFVTGVNKLCCTLLNQTYSTAFVFLKLPLFTSVCYKYPAEKP